MKPPPFTYRRPRTLDEAVSQLAESDGEAKVLAGGQSLVPLLKFRLLAPQVLVDINGLEDLDGVKPGERGLRIGALTRHRTVETSALVRERCPVLASAAAEVGHLAIRNRGTFGGSLQAANSVRERHAHRSGGGRSRARLDRCAALRRERGLRAYDQPHGRSRARFTAGSRRGWAPFCSRRTATTRAASSSRAP